MSETWEEAVLAIMKKRPRDTWTLQEIYAGIAKRPLVTARHQEIWGSQPNFHHWVRSTIARLKAAGRIVHVGQARYRLPP